MTTSVDEKRNGHSGLVKQLQSEEELQAFLNAPPVYEPGQEESHEFISSVDERRKKRYGQNGHKNGQIKSSEHHTLPVSPLEVFDLVDLLHETFEPLQWIIPDYLPEGLTLFFSRPKVGKSMLALALGLRMARRVSGGIDGTVLYLTLDDTSKRRLQSRTRSLLQGEEIERDRVWASTQSQALDSGLVDQLTLWVQDHSDTKLIVIDVYARIKPKKQDDDIYKSDYNALVMLQEFAVKHHIAILLVHHTRKKNDTEDWIDSCNGSTGLTAAVDTLWTLERKPRSNALTLRVKGRDTMGELAVELNLDELDAPWKLDTEESEQEVNATEQRILDVLYNTDEALKPKRIAELTGIKYTTVRGTLRRMDTKNLVDLEQSPYGSYKVTKLQQENTCNFVTSPSQPVDKVALQAHSEEATKSYKSEDNCNSVTLVTLDSSDREPLVSNGQVDHHERKPTKPKPDFDCYQCEALHIKGSTWQWDSNAHNWICTNMARHGRQVILTETEIDMFGPKRK